MNKYLVVRFSSFGDIAQSLPTAKTIANNDPGAQIHWLTRADFAPLVETCPEVHRVWAFSRNSGLKGLFRLLGELRKEGITHVYDAHNNLRSFLVVNFFRLSRFGVRVVRRSKFRWRRLLLFRFRINLFPTPFRGVESFQVPLSKWFPNARFDEKFELRPPAETLHKAPLPKDFKLHEAYVLAPSAAWELKRWPVEHWLKLTNSCSEIKFVLLAGKEDTFCDEITKGSPGNVLDLRGKVSWLESVAIVSGSKGIISGDTGILHVADVMGKRTIGLIGPTAFGFPIRSTTQVAEVPLWCRPCTKDGRGRCRNSEFQKCMRDIDPFAIARLVKTS